MEYQKALKIALEVKELLSPHCERIEIAGRIRIPFIEPEKRNL